MPMSPRVLSLCFPRAGPQDGQSFLRRLSVAAVTQPAGGVHPLSRINLGQVSGAEEIPFCQC